MMNFLSHLLSSGSHSLLLPFHPPISGEVLDPGANICYSANFRSASSLRTPELVRLISMGLACSGLLPPDVFHLGIL